MQFSIQREALLKPLQQVIGVVERRQTLPVLANLLVKVGDGKVSLTGTDLEVEMVASTSAEKLADGEITIPARKLFDIVRALPDGAQIDLKLNGDRVALNAGRSRFTLTTLAASEFPTVDEIELVETVSLPEQVLRDLMEHTSFAMANQDVRYYLNGMLLDLQEHTLRCVATDGHRLAMKETQLQSSVTTRRQIIIPRKGVNELVGLLESGDGEVALEFGRNHLRVRRGSVVFTSKLIDGRFPDYEAVIPLGADKTATLDREVLRGALQRAAILCARELVIGQREMVHANVAVTRIGQRLDREAEQRETLGGIGEIARVDLALCLEARGQVRVSEQGNTIRTQRKNLMNRLFDAGPCLPRQSINEVDVDFVYSGIPHAVHARRRNFK